MSTAAALDEKGVILPCPACGQKNRLPFARLGQTGTCGSFQADLPQPSVPVEVDSEQRFAVLLGASALPIVVDFWAPWCGPCRMVAPEMEKVAAANAGRLLVVKVNTEALPDLGQRYQVRSIPLLAVFANGREAGRSAGARPASAIEAFVRETLGAA